MNAPDNILDKIRKLLVRAQDERGSTEGERETALRMAHKLMAQYQLDQLDLDEHERYRDDPIQHFDEESYSTPWTNSVRHAIADLFNVRYFLGRKINATRMKHHFVGRTSDATTAMLMSAWIVAGLVKEARNYGGGQYQSPAGRAFGIGAASKLRSRVNEMIKANVEEVKAGSGRDLVVVNTNAMADNDDFIEATMGFKLKSRAVRRTSYSMRDFAAGSKHADSINLSKQLANRAGTLAIKG